ncbi:MAG TPA: hypothetical protein VN679_05315 [Candidatus Acidoferrales bacterium]|nr:hypothetical protein [Candidatus Acidoferrales bacterium]
MKDLLQVSADMSQRVTGFLIPLQTTRRIDLDSLEAILDSAKSASELLKECEQVPKALMKDLRILSKALRAEAPHFGDNASILQKAADRLDYLFDLILWSESPMDMKPGVPRFV